MIKNIQTSTDPRRIELEGRILVAHQAELYPWLGFVSKATMGDVYLILDDSQFKKEYFENRNKIRVKNEPGWEWITIPVNNKDHIRNIDEYKIIGNDWKKKHLKVIELSYRRAPFFVKYYEELLNIYSQFNSDRLIDFNVEIIKYAFQKFEIQAPIFRTSELKQNGVTICGKGSELVLSLCKALSADVFVAGQSGKNYLNLTEFQNNRIDLVFQQFNHPSYKQYHGNFIPYMSFIDLLFNHGDESISVLAKSNYTK